MFRFRVCLLVLCFVASVGCGKSGNSSAPEQPKNEPIERMTVENTNRIVSQQMDYNGVVQMFATQGEGTNEEKSGLMPGNKFVWKEGTKKVYVSFGLNGKANGVAWEGFGGR